MFEYNFDSAVNFWRKNLIVADREKALQNRNRKIWNRRKLASHGHKSHKRYKLVTKYYALKPLTNLCEKKNNLFTLNTGTKYQRGCLKGETAAFTSTGMAEKHLRGPDCKQARKIKNPDNLPEEHFWGTIFDDTFCNSGKTNDYA